MSKNPTVEILQLKPTDVLQFEEMMTLFGEAFEEIATYCDNRPSRLYLESLLASHDFIAIAAIQQEKVVGGLAAYELKKFEQERSEIYIYDLAVAASHRRQGIATALIQKVRKVASERGIGIIFVQADYQDAPAIALYEKLGARAEVLHFDIAVSELEEDVLQ
ncbi:MAG: AAC(3)-I family aminoglycoside N-acetyltransferase [Cyanobacteriota bacterium]|nr:AAC(3)-I family aminoglycoside N-acetyltransferase [Cyanobacteriota bacterium]